MTSQIPSSIVGRFLPALLPLLLCLTQTLPGQSPSARNEAKARRSPNGLIDAETWFRCIEEGKHHSQVMDHLDHLCNRIGPRLTASDNYSIATKWAADRFRSFGMDRVHLDKWGSFPVGFNRGPSSGKIVAPASMARTLEFSTNAWSAGTKGRQEGPVLVLEGRVGPQQVQERAKEVKGAWIFSKRIGPRSLQTMRALQQAGALGLVRSGGGKYLYSFGAYQQRWERLPTFPVITLLAREYLDITKAAEKIDDPKKQIRIAFDIRNYFKKGPIDVHNVIAEIPGTEKPDEVVIVGGHIDSWDGATGATDNGTGASSTLEAARILMASGARPKRTIRFMLFGGEEQGLLGSRSYAQRNRKQLQASVSGVFIHDMGTNYVSGIGGPPDIKPMLDQAFAGFDTIDTGFPFKVHKAAASLAGGSSDHASFLSLGIPGFFWNQKGRAVYQHGWHTQFDTYDLAIPEYQKQTATVVALGALAVANLPEMLPRWKAQPRTSRRLPPRPFDPKNPRLGVYVDGTRILGVVPQSLAAVTGLRGGDEIQELAGAKIEAQGDIATALGAWVGKGMPEATVKFERNNKVMVLPLRRSAVRKGAAGKKGANEKGAKKVEPKRVKV